MTAQELKDYIDDLWTRVGTDRISGADMRNVGKAIVDFAAAIDVDDAIPDWTALLTFQTDGSDDGKYCKHPDSNGKKRIFETKVDDNIGNEPPTNPAITEDANWIEISASSGSAINEWAPGVYGAGLVIVFHNHSVDGRGLYILLDPVRPFTSADIEAEGIAGKWALVNKEYIDATSLQAENNAKAYADSIVIGLWDDRGNYDASGNMFPASGGSGAAGTVLKGDIWTINEAGVLGGVNVNIGDTVRALSDSPGQNANDWAIAESNLGYPPENTGNKATNFSVLNHTLYPTTQAVKENFFYNSGNAFGANAVIGTNDTFDFSIKTNNATRLILSGDSGRLFHTQESIASSVNIIANSFTSTINRGTASHVATGYRFNSVFTGVTATAISYGLDIAITTGSTALFRFGSDSAGSPFWNISGNGVTTQWGTSSSHAFIDITAGNSGWLMRNQANSSSITGIITFGANSVSNTINGSQTFVGINGNAGWSGTSAGSFTWFKYQATLNSTATGAMTFIDYNPGIVALAGPHFGIRIRPAAFNGFGLGSAEPTAIVHVRGANDGKAFIVEDDSGNKFIEMEENAGVRRIGVFGVAPVSRRVVPTGSSADDIITALQELGWFSQT